MWTFFVSVPKVSRLQREMHQGEQKLDSAEGQISTLKEAQDRLLEELDATRARLRETSNLLMALQVTTTHTPPPQVNVYNVSEYKQMEEKSL